MSGTFSVSLRFFGTPNLNPDWEERASLWYHSVSYIGHIITFPLDRQMSIILNKVVRYINYLSICGIDSFRFRDLAIRNGFFLLTCRKCTSFRLNEVKGRLKIHQLVTYTKPNCRCMEFRRRQQHLRETHGARVEEHEDRSGGHPDGGYRSPDTADGPFRSSDHHGCRSLHHVRVHRGAAGVDHRCDGP